ncbi:MAG: hypothetical protein KUA43_21465 [Hoeflea sp.]|jgi:hypothetical protein|uniref:hypothetical protein n=1 Tax=unclassified Hoeflea TaxID=2614931 RepID=UPI0012512798|nr:MULTISPECIES: hypothetical protein [unclassified Hoeflea]MBU4527514.1 hypothetical protein [Alphaproteobacteria bacterium]MBU4543958.1 hypothetical protein [Alphaproteobacteria bacterium]MBU4552378.1 hypothetical protein [Alphaproteobacteria bacterium]MBV1726017.1 hypothetical protein [Hoeflea sp.]MBV1782375.1 hypothetical protein [Hoeflea sp.]
MIKPIKSLTMAAVLMISIAAVPTLQAAEHKTPSNQGSMMEEGSMGNNKDMMNQDGMSGMGGMMGMMKMMAQMAPMMEQCTKVMASMTDNMKLSTDQ